jgi:hypothetical protein
MDNKIEILYTKEGFEFVKLFKNKYSLKFNIENPHIVLYKIIDFNLMKLIYDLNNDIYEKVNLEKISDNEAVMTMLMKNLFEDLGMPQKFTYVNIKKYQDDNKITFISQSINSERPEGMPFDAEQLPLQLMICNCDIITHHKILFTIDILFNQNMIVPSFAEKMIGIIIFKIFNRVKQFIEKVRI